MGILRAHTGAIGCIGLTTTNYLYISPRKTQNYMHKLRSLANLRELRSSANSRELKLLVKV